MKPICVIRNKDDTVFRTLHLHSGNCIIRALWANHKNMISGGFVLMRLLWEIFLAFAKVGNSDMAEAPR